MLARGGQFHLCGEHNLENVLAAASAAILAGAEPAAIAQRRVAALPASSTASNLWPKSAACSYFNDSKATNVDATQKALEAFPGECS